MSLKETEGFYSIACSGTDGKQTVDDLWTLVGWKREAGKTVR